MPQAPIIIPIIITGILVGTIAASKGTMVKRKKLLLASLLSGILNVVNAYLLILLTPARTFQYQGQFTGTAQSTYRYRGGGGANSQLLLLISSFIVGFLIPLAVIGIGMLYARRKAGKGFDEEGGKDDLDFLKEDDSEKEEDSEKVEDTEELFKKDSKKESKKDSKKDLKQDYDEEF
ncbi:MAG: hypothetical protein ACHQ03_02985 [Candidatus Bathyarchaeia archaeon]